MFDGWQGRKDCIGYHWGTNGTDLKVLLLFESFVEDPTGLIVFRLCERLAPIRELHLSALTFGEDGPLSMRLREMGIYIHPTSPEDCQSTRQLRELGAKFLRRADGPDVVHSFCRWPDVKARYFHGGHDSVALVSSVYDLVTYRRHSWLKRMSLRRAEQKTRNYCSKILQASEFVEREMAEFDIAENLLERLSPGVDAVQAFPLSPKSRERYRDLIGVDYEAPLLVSAGQIRESEGYLDMLEAMPRILERHPGAKWFLVGEGEYRSVIEERVRALGLGNSVRLIGQLNEVLPKIFSTADLVVHPCRVDRISVNVPLAMAAGTAVVATSTGSIPEVIVDRETGSLVPPQNPAAIAEAALELLDDEAWRMEMGRNARLYIMDHHELNVTSARYLEIWRELAPNAVWGTTDSIPVEAMQEAVETM